MSKKERFSLETGPKIITLDDLINPSRAVPEDYQKLILKAQEKQHSNRHDVAHSKIFQCIVDCRFQDISDTPERREILAREQQYYRDHLQGRVLIDLGGGLGSTMRKFAKICGVDTYINVDADLETETGLELNPLVPAYERIENDLQEIGVKADALDFIARLKDGSANFVVNGIDMSIIPDMRYHEALARELGRATQPGGLCFGHYSTSMEIMKPRPQHATYGFTKHKGLPAVALILEKSE